MKGILTFYIKYMPEHGQDPIDTVNMVKNFNDEAVKKLEESDYLVIFVPTVGESSRIERSEFPITINSTEDANE